MKKTVALMMLLVLTLNLYGCKRKEPQPTPPSGQNYDALSQKIYDQNLGEFYEAYQAAKKAETVSERYALMAIAEAKLLVSGVMLPLRCNGGSYGISRVAPHTVPQVLWGSDSMRYQDAVVTTAPISTAHRTQMEKKYAQLKGTGKYKQWAKTFLKEKGYTLKNSYATAYSADPQTWDVLATAMSSDNEAIVNTYDGLVAYDAEGMIRPALATDWEKTVNTDGTVSYTFRLREGVRWVNSQGMKVGEVQADDFVAGMQHMLDAKGGLEYLVEGVIVNADAYLDGSVVDFGQVGVKALDKHRVSYTLTGDIPYFMTMLGYGVFAPMSRSYYLSQGGAFGLDYAQAAEGSGYVYGISPSHIAYCGPYLVSNSTEKNTIVFRANDSYWNKKNLGVQTIVWRYNDGNDALKGYTDCMNGVVDATTLNAASLAKAQSDGNLKKYGYVTPSGATSYMAFYNLNRTMLHNFNDANGAVSSKTGQQVDRYNKAIQNVHFRRALSFAVDRGAYNAQVVGEALKLTSLRNTFTPGNFVELPESVTVKIGDRDREFPKGTPYGVIVQAQLDADGVPIRVWDEKKGSADGFDGWFNPENALAELNKAAQQLNMTIDKNNPIYVDMPYFSGSEAHANRARAYKRSVETALQSRVVINLVSCASNAELLYAGYYPPTGAEANYDVCDVSGWGPDYGDPQTYLDTMLPDYAGYLMKTLGIF